MDSKICVLGLGYIGLPTASMFAINGYWVVGVDINTEIVETINKGNVHIQEPGLDTLVTAATRSGHLIAQSIPETADVFIIAVPTPVTEDKKADLKAVIGASEAMVPYLRKGNLVILESTVPPGTSQDLVVPILERSSLSVGIDFHVVHAPERVLPGQIMKELVQNDRILGGIDQRSAERARDLYRSFVTGEIYLTDATSAELVKLVENTYRDVNIALANELARIGESLNVDVWQIIELANKHPRVNILNPGPGVGGHCIPVDPWFIVEKLPNETKLIHQARLTNDSMPDFVCQGIMDLLTDVKNPVIGILGVAYKANVDDMRESPSLDVVKLLEEQGCQVKVHDPYIYPQVSLDDVADGADCLVLLVDHREYEFLDIETLSARMRRKLLYAAKKLNNQSAWKGAGFRIRQLGKPANILERQHLNS